MDRKYKFQSKYEAKIRLIRCYLKQVTFLRCYCKKWKVFSSKLWINVNKTWWKNHHNQGRFYLLYSREPFIVYQKEKKIQKGKWNCYRQGCIFSWSRPVKLDPPLVRISHAYKWCATLCIQYTDSLNHIHRTHGKKSTVHSIRIFGIKRLYHIFIYIFLLEHNTNQ